MNVRVSVIVKVNVRHKVKVKVRVKAQYYFTGFWSDTIATAKALIIHYICRPYI